MINPKFPIRWLIRRDMPEVMEIERESFEFTWTKDDFLHCLRQRNCIGMVASCAPINGDSWGRIAGYMIYELHQAKLQVLNFAVATDMRRSEVGTSLMGRLIDKLSYQRRREIGLEVRETNVAAQLFFKQQGFVATTVLRNHYQEEDGYHMLYTLPTQQQKSSNRIKAFYDAT